MQEPSVKKNFIYSTSYQILNVLTPFITAPYISRVLGAEGIGIQSYTQSIQQYFLMFAALGTLSYGAREISMNRNDVYKRSKLFWEIELMTVNTSLLAVVGWVILILFSSKYKVYYTVLTIGIFASMFDISWFFEGIEQFKLEVIRNSFFKILGIICLFIFIKSPNDLLLYIFITTVSTLLSSLSLWPYMKRYLVKVNPREFVFKRHFRETLIYFIPTIATSIYTVLDKTLIGLITNSAAQNGYYQQAEKVINLAKSVVFTAINSVIGVRNSFLFAEKKYDEIHEKIKQSFNFIFFAGFACCFGIMGVAKTFVPLFFGPGYDAVVELLYIFSPIIIIIGISNCLGSQYYTPCGKRKQSANYLIVGSVVNLSLNLLLIPKFGAYGAAVASVAAETAITILYVKYSEGYGDVRLLINTGLKKLVAGIGMFAVVYPMNKILINPLILIVFEIVTGALLYGLLLLVLRDEWMCQIVKTVIFKVREKW
ncbi:MAG: oligosaccharide flippase family protein [Spirochaetales bacterium]|nr:oligosaccharide flippase family protein [Spirochaetales bacterium]